MAAVQRKTSPIQGAVHALAGSRTAEWMVRKTPLNRISRQFVPGMTPDELMSAVRDATAAGLAVTVNYLGEEEKSAEAAAETGRVYLKLVERLKAEGLPGGISLKFSQLGQTIGDDVLLCNLEPLLTAARENGTFLRFDMESSAYTERTLAAFDRLWQDGWRNVGVVLQSCLFRTEADVRRMNEMGVSVRLCKGAYQEPPAVAFQYREEVNRNFIACMKMLLAEGNFPRIATHDEKLIRETTAYAREKQIDPNRFEFQMLYGVRKDLQQQLLADGYSVRVYMPYGSSWYPYLMRRLAERPANILLISGSMLRQSPIGFLWKRRS